MISLYESILSVAQLTESIFTVADPSAAKNIVDVVSADVKKRMFDGSEPIFAGAPLQDIKHQPDGIIKNVDITKDNILKISGLNRRTGCALHVSLDDRTKKLFDEYGITGIEFNPSRKGDSNIESILTLLTPPYKNVIDLRTSQGSFKIINSKGMFTNLMIASRCYDLAMQPAHIKNLMFTGDNVITINIYNRILDNCDFGSCSSINFWIQLHSIKPTAIMKNCKVNASLFNLYISGVKDDIFQDWTDYLIDENGPRKDLLKRLGVDATGIRDIFLIMTRRSDSRKMVITTYDKYIDLNIKDCGVGGCHISGLSKEVKYTIYKA